MKTLFALLFLTIPLTQAGTMAGTALPPGVTANAIQADASGNLYVAGSVTPVQPKAIGDTSDAYVAKLSPDGSVVWSAILGGSGAESAAALAVTASGSVVVTGTTSSTDFPLPAGAIQSRFPGSSGVLTQAFVAVFDANGNSQNATLLGGAVTTQGRDVVLAPTGEVIVTGYAAYGFVTTPNVAPFQSSSFLVKLDATLQHLEFASTVGGQRLAVDSAGNIYVAGTLSQPNPGPMTPGAFQTTFVLQPCGGTFQTGEPCLYQYVAKVNPTATNLIYATFLTGSHGATPARLIVDTQGNAIVAGSTYSSDYPTTPSSFEPLYVADAPSPPPYPNVSLFTEIYPPPQTGFVTKLNAQGTGLIFSTFLGGSYADIITDLAAGSDGFLYLAGTAQSDDFPAVFGVPAPCLPQFFLARLSADGSSLAHTLTFSSNLLCPNCAASTQTAELLLDNLNHPTILVGSRALAKVNLTMASPPIACVLDAADLQPVSAVVPGQLLSIFGNAVGFGNGYTPPTTGGVFPVSFNLNGTNVETTFNGVLAPMLYYAGDQINVQVPFEVAGSSTAQIQFDGSGGNESITFPVVASSPSLFIRPQPDLECGGFGATYGGGQSPLAFNADGSLNSCANPAAPGSTITVYLNGLGAVALAEVTGAVETSVVTLSESITADPGISGPIQQITAVSVPGSVDGVWRAEIQLPATVEGNVILALSVAGQPVRERQAVIWTAPGTAH